MKALRDKKLEAWQRQEIAAIACRRFADGRPRYSLTYVASIYGVSHCLVSRLGSERAGTYRKCYAK